MLGTIKSKLETAVLTWKHASQTRRFWRTVCTDVEKNAWRNKWRHVWY